MKQTTKQQLAYLCLRFSHKVTDIDLIWTNYKRKQPLRFRRMTSQGRRSHAWQEKREEIWLSPVTKAPTPTEKSKKQRDNIKNATKNFDYTTIANFSKQGF